LIAQSNATEEVIDVGKSVTVKATFDSYNMIIGDAMCQTIDWKKEVRRMVPLPRNKSKKLPQFQKQQW